MKSDNQQKSLSCIFSCNVGERNNFTQMSNQSIEVSRCCHLREEASLINLREEASLINQNGCGKKEYQDLQMWRVE